MIFVTVGTTDFDDLVRALDAMAPDLNDEMVIQYGHGTHEPQNCEAFRFTNSLDPYYEKADLVISHGGLCTVMEVCRRGLKLVAMANPDRFDDHQTDILSYMSDAGHLVWCRSFHALPEAIDTARRKTFVPYDTPECRIAETVQEFLSKLTPR